MAFPHFLGKHWEKVMPIRTLVPGTRLFIQGQINLHPLIVSLQEQVLIPEFPKVTLHYFVGCDIPWHPMGGGNGWCFRHKKTDQPSGLNTTTQPVYLFSVQEDTVLNTVTHTCNLSSWWKENEKISIQLHSSRPARKQHLRRQSKQGRVMPVKSTLRMSLWVWDHIVSTK